MAFQICDNAFFMRLVGKKKKAKSDTVELSRYLSFMQFILHFSLDFFFFFFSYAKHTMETGCGKLEK